MSKLSDFLFNLSPKKLGVYLVLGPMVLFLVQTIFSIVFRNASANELVVSGTMGLLSLLLAGALVLWMVWLRTTVYSVEENKLGLARKWFQIAYAFLWIFIVFNAGATVIESLLEKGYWNKEYMYLIYASREFVNFGGIMIAYPIVCHYAARATTIKLRVEPATFTGAIPFTLLLIFGTTLSIPFLHSYFSKKNSTTTEILIIYGMAFGVFILTLIIGFIAAITGLV